MENMTSVAKRIRWMEADEYTGALGRKAPAWGMSPIKMKAKWAGIGH